MSVKAPAEARQRKWRLRIELTNPFRRGRLLVRGFSNTLAGVDTRAVHRRIPRHRAIDGPSRRLHSGSDAQCARGESPRPDRGQCERAGGGRAGGAHRYIAQSGCYYYVPGPGLASEETTFAVDAPPLVAGSARALLELEKRVLGAQSLEGIVLRYGFFYGAGTWWASDGSVAEQVRRRQFPITGGGGGVWSFVHIADAAAATLAALTRGARGAYNVADDEPSPLAVWLPAYARWLGAPTPAQVSADEVEDPDARFYAMQLRGASNAKVKHALGLRPRRREWLGDTK